MSLPGHDEHHFTETLFIRDIIIGMSDGLTVPFALAAGLAGVVDSNATILTAGVAEIVAGSIAMGLGGYLASKTQAEHYQGELRREHQEVRLIPEQEKQEIRDILQVYGIRASTQDLLIADLSRDKDQWVDFMMKFELGLEKPNLRQASRSALSIGLSYFFGGAVPLLPFYLTSDPWRGLVFSSGTTLCALFAFGFAKSLVLGQKPLWGAIKVTMIGGVAAAAAFFVTRLI
jgi:vacuolar iron transporter family protein